MKSMWGFIAGISRDSSGSVSRLRHPRVRWSASATLSEVTAGVMNSTPMRSPWATPSPPPIRPGYADRLYAAT